MRPAAFALEMPEELSDALRLLEHRGDEAIVLAGGQTRIPLLNMRIARPDRIVDLRGSSMGIVRAQITRVGVPDGEGGGDIGNGWGDMCGRAPCRGGGG